MRTRRQVAEQKMRELWRERIQSDLEAGQVQPVEEQVAEQPAPEAPAVDDGFVVLDPSELEEVDLEVEAAVEVLREVPTPPALPERVDHLVIPEVPEGGYGTDRHFRRKP